jgi:hypothetical protein
MEETKNKKRDIMKEKQNTEDKRRQATGTHQEENKKRIKQGNMKMREKQYRDL